MLMIRKGYNQSELRRNYCNISNFKGQSFEDLESWGWAEQNESSSDGPKLLHASTQLMPFVTLSPQMCHTAATGEQYTNKHCQT